MPRTHSVTDVEISVRTVQQAVELGMKAEFDRIHEPYYEDSEPLLTRELIHCNTVYFARGADGTLLDFFWSDGERFWSRGDRRTLSTSV